MAGYFCPTLCLCNPLMLHVAAIHVFHYFLGFCSMNTSKSIHCLICGQLGAMMNIIALNTLDISFAGQKPSFLLGEFTEVGFLCSSSSPSVFPHHTDMLVHAGAGHSPGFLHTCS